MAMRGDKKRRQLHRLHFSGVVVQCEGFSNSRERSSTFSLEFPVIGPLVFGEARSKVAPHGKGYTWVPVLRSFDKLRKVRVFSYLFYSLAKGHFNGWGFVKAGWSWFRFQKIWTM